MERAAFARALQYLRYHPAATWSAILTGVFSAIFFLFLVVVLALFADLLVNRGEAPCYAQAPVSEKAAFHDWLGAMDKTADRKDGLAPLQRQAAALGVGDAWLALIVADPARLSAADQDRRRSLLWMLHLPAIVEDAVGPGAADALRAAFKNQMHGRELAVALQGNLPDLGILSLVVRSSSSPHGWPASLIARWASWTWAHGNFVHLQGLFVLALVLGILRAGFLALSTYLAAWATIEALTRLRRTIYHQTYRLGALAFRAVGPTEAAAVATRHVESVHLGLFIWLTVIFREPVKFGLLLLFAMLVHFWLALAFVLFALLVWVVGGQIAAYFRRRGRAAEHRAADQLAQLQESMMMMRLVKIYLMEQFNQTRVEGQLRRYAQAQLERYRAESTYRPLFSLLGLIAAMLLLALSGFVVLYGYLGVTSALVMASVLVCLYWPLVAFLEARRVLKHSRLAAAEMFVFLDRQGSVGQMVEAEFLPALSKALEFDNVSFKEPGGERKLLQNVSLTIKTGERVALVGPDDVEKHALVYLLPRFLDPSSGEIRIDKKNIRWVTLDSLRAQIGMVLQHNLVFNDTVANNIGCGDPAYSLPRIVEAAKVAHAHQYVQKLPQGYETVIGEQGHPLEPGVQFLIALARAILRDPAMLIIEEPHEPMSDDLKALVDDTFARVLPNRTVLFLPHRLSTIRGCNRVLLLYQGKIEAVGEHRELLAKSDLYRHLQYLEFNEFGNANQPEGALS